MKESINYWIKSILLLMVLCQMTPIKVWLHTARSCTHQSFACLSYKLNVRLLGEEKGLPAPTLGLNLPEVIYYNCTIHYLDPALFAAVIMWLIFEQIGGGVGAVQYSVSPGRVNMTNQSDIGKHKRQWPDGRCAEISWQKSIFISESRRG